MGALRVAGIGRYKSRRRLSQISPGSSTIFNIEIGPHRRFDWLRYDLDEVKDVKNRLGATVNDVVLANVAGALRSFLIQRDEDVSDLDFQELKAAARA